MRTLHDFGILCLPDSHYSNIMIESIAISFALFLTEYLCCLEKNFLTNLVKFGRRQFNYKASPHHITPEVPLHIFHKLKKVNTPVKMYTFYFLNRNISGVTLPITTHTAHYLAITHTCCCLAFSSFYQNGHGGLSSVPYMFIPFWSFSPGEYQYFSVVYSLSSEIFFLALPRFFTEDCEG